jgi:hypothetical protein
MPQPGVPQHAWRQLLQHHIALQRMLGSQYFVDCADEHVTISDGDNHLILAVDG